MNLRNEGYFLVTSKLLAACRHVAAFLWNSCLGKFLRKHFSETIYCLETICMETILCKQLSWDILSFCLFTTTRSIRGYETVRGDTQRVFSFEGNWLLITFERETSLAILFMKFWCFQDSNLDFYAKFSHRSKMAMCRVNWTNSTLGASLK